MDLKESTQDLWAYHDLTTPRRVSCGSLKTLLGYLLSKGSVRAETSSQIEGGYYSEITVYGPVCDEAVYSKGCPPLTSESSFGSEAADNVKDRLEKDKGARLHVRYRATLKEARTLSGEDAHALRERLRELGVKNASVACKALGLPQVR